MKSAETIGIVPTLVVRVGFGAGGHPSRRGTKGSILPAMTTPESWLLATRLRALRDRLAAGAEADLAYFCPLVPDSDRAADLAELRASRGDRESPGDRQSLRGGATWGEGASSAEGASSGEGAARFCHQCGQPATAGDVFCRKCGTKLK